MEIKRLLDERGFRFNKQFGQNFLTDESILEDICQDAGVNGDAVLEVGAGAGTLTRVLSRHADKVVTFEIDKNLRDILQITLADCHNVQLVIGDIMKYPMSRIEELCGESYRVVANIPYYITSPFITRFVEETNCARSLTLTVQYEVARRLSASPRTKDYGALSVAVQSVADVTLTRVLGRELFYPKPNVDSAVVTLDFKDKFDIADRDLFRKTVRSAFSMRRKTLANCLANGFGISKEQSAAIIEKCGFSANCRGEELSVEQFVAMYKILKEELK